MSGISDSQLTTAVITYNAESYLRDCLTSLRAAGQPDGYILVVDDGSTDRTAIIMAEEFPGIRFVSEGKNQGHSHACNRAINEAATSWVVLIDHDTVVHRDWLVEMKRGVECQPEAAIVIARTVFDGDRRTIHADGGFAHYLGNMILLNGFTPLEKASNVMVEIGAAGTTSMAVNRNWAIGIGGFDEDFFIYLNDFEFSLRVRMAGGHLYCAPLAIIYHKGGTPSVSFRGKDSYPPRRAYLILRNRWFLILKLYSARTLALAFPALLFYEGVLLLMAVRKGVLREYARAWGWLICNRDVVREHRRAAQEIRRVGDAELLTVAPLTFVPGVVSGGAAQFMKNSLDRCFSFYWRIIFRGL